MNETVMLEHQRPARISGEDCGGGRERAARAGADENSDAGGAQREYGSQRIRVERQADGGGEVGDGDGELQGWFKPKRQRQINRKDTIRITSGLRIRRPDVNGEKITHPTKLASGDLIEVAAGIGICSAGLRARAVTAGGKAVMVGRRGKSGGRAAALQRDDAVAKKGSSFTPLEFYCDGREISWNARRS